VVRLTALPDRPDTLSLHDLAVAPEARGHGVARTLFAAVHALARERGFASVSLVAVQGSDPFWARLGFRAVEHFEYAPGVPAVRMVLENLAHPPTP
jgi:predicted N-acetyltransferase YhbS